jgi:hypothetical protein
MDTEAAAKPAAAAGGGAAPQKPRRKLGQKPGGDHPKLARELPKKSGYLLKKGPLKVRGLQPHKVPLGPQAGTHVDLSALRGRITSLQVWQKRWFVLEEGELSYYRSHTQVRRSSHPPPVDSRPPSDVPLTPAVLHVRPVS